MTADDNTLAAIRERVNLFGGALAPAARDDIDTLLAMVEQRDAEIERLRAEIERFRPLWALPLAAPSRWTSEPIRYPRRYVSTLDVLKTYVELIRCSSDWPQEARHAAMDRALHSIPDLAYEIDHLRQDLDEARAAAAKAGEVVAAVEAVADDWERHADDEAAAKDRGQWDDPFVVRGRFVNMLRMHAHQVTTALSDPGQHVRAIRAQAWDEGVRRCDQAWHDGDATSVFDRNPYRAETNEADL